jgi:hypothetical protein
VVINGYCQRYRTNDSCDGVSCLRLLSGASMSARCQTSRGCERLLLNWEGSVYLSVRTTSHFTPYFSAWPLVKLTLKGAQLPS